MILFILGLATSWTVLQLYQGCSYDSGSITGIVYREVWNKKNQAVLEPFDRSVRILLTGVEGADAYIGKTVRVQGIPKQPEGDRNPGGYSQKEYLYSKNVRFTMDGKSLQKYPVDSSPGIGLHPRVIGSRIRNSIEEILSVYMDEEDLHFLLGVMTGDTSRLDEDEKEWIRLSGLSHLMAVSGMHVTYMMMPVRSLVKRKRMDIALRSGLCLIPLGIFTTVAGFTPSVVRAAIMCGCNLIARIVHRKADFLNTLGLAGCVCLFLYPMGVTDTGLVLSFGAVLSGYFMSGRVAKLFCRKEGAKAPVIDALCYGLAVQIGLLPIMLYQFNMVSFAGLFLSIAAAPLAAAMCILGYLICILGAIPLLDFFAGLISYILTAVTGALTAVSRGGSVLPALRTVSPPIWLMLLYYGVLWWLLWGRKHFTGKRLFAAAAALTIVCISGIVCTRAPVKIIWFDVGQGSCALICTRDGAKVLIDGGNGFTDVSGLLWKNGVSHIDAVILSHGDSDHCEGLNAVIEEHAVDCLYVPDNPEDNNAMVLAEKAAEKGIETVFVSGRASMILSDTVRAELYSHPVESSFNNSSLVVQLISDFGCVLFPGDLEAEGERLLTEGDFLSQCDTVTAAHHGASNGTGELLLARTKPYFAVISVGKNNFYGHPTEQLLKRLEAYGVKVFRTDQDGAILMDYGSNGMIGVVKWLPREKLQYRK